MPALPAIATRCTPEACSSWGSDARACRVQITTLLPHGPVGWGAGECRKPLWGHLADWPTAGCQQEWTPQSQACMTRRKCWISAPGCLGKEVVMAQELQPEVSGHTAASGGPGAGAAVMPGSRNGCSPTHSSCSISSTWNPCESWDHTVRYWCFRQDIRRPRSRRLVLSDTSKQGVH